MEYRGRLYGKVAGKYLPLTQTTEDIEKIRHQRDDLLSLLEEAEYHLSGSKFSPSLLSDIKSLIEECKVTQ